MNNKPFSQACENNKQPILDILSTVFSDNQHVLEIGTGTGQHAVFFAPNLPHLQWQTSDLAINHLGINQWLDELPADNLHKPISLDLDETWPTPNTNLKVDGIYTANTLHIISWPLVMKFFEGISDNLSTNGNVCIYGPFKYQGKFTSDSNERFDQWLKEQNNHRGIRDFEVIQQLANAAGLKLTADHVMPANNQLLVFSKK